MNTKTIDGACYARMLLGGAACLAAHSEELNSLNVFPVADGDTGTNMLKTMEGGLAEVSHEENQPVGTLSSRFARGVLLSARGNSGVILSQIFAGINDGLVLCESASAEDLAEAYRKGIAKSYASVQNPTEGTILTVFRESTEYAQANLTEESTVEDFFRLHIEEARRSLASTKERLSVLAEADVVDSGAAGYLYIAEGMYHALTGEEVSYELTETKTEAKKIDIDGFTRDSVLEYGYCTEVLLRLTSAKVDPDTFKIETILSLLGELGGESIVAYKQDDLVKVHVHTFNPGEILSRVQAFGEFLTVKIENMSLGHSESEAAKKKSTKAFSVVSVATGDGLAALFTQMGADYIVSGGQSANPSIEDFIKAFESLDTKEIIVLPNNKNVILAAKQAASLYGERNAAVKIRVLETKSLAEGYSALAVITPAMKDMDALEKSANQAARSVADGEVTVAIRDAVVDGQPIKEGEYLALSKGSLLAVGKTPEDAVLGLLEKLDTDLAEIITLFVGKGVGDERRTRLADTIAERYDECEVVTYLGEQDVYDYLIAVE